MTKLAWCPCQDETCPFNPANHDQGCNLCVEDSLKCGEIPKCFFLKVTDTVDGFEDWSFEHFAELALSNDMSGETKMEFREVSRDKRQILGKETCDEILNKATSGVLCVLGDGDYPYGVPIGFAYKNNKIYFHGMPSGHKYDAMKNHEKVCLTVIETDQVVPEEYTTYFRSVILFGRARIVEDLEEKHKIVDYLVEKYSPGLEEGVHETFEKRIAWMGAFEIDIEHISGKEAIELAEPGWQLEELKDR